MATPAWVLILAQEHPPEMGQKVSWGGLLLVLAGAVVLGYLVRSLIRRLAGPVREQSRPRPSLRSCPQCGGELPRDAPEGLCPRCLLRRGLGRSSPSDAEAGPEPTSAFHGPGTAPTPADLAPHFPQLEVLELIGQGGMG